MMALSFCSRKAIIALKIACGTWFVMPKAQDLQAAFFWIELFFRREGVTDDYSERFGQYRDSPTGFGIHRLGGGQYFDGNGYIADGLCVVADIRG
jgi:hypothetical protein